MTCITIGKVRRFKAFTLQERRLRLHKKEIANMPCIEWSILHCVAHWSMHPPHIPYKDHPISWPIDPSTNPSFHTLDYPSVRPLTHTHPRYCTVMCGHASKVNLENAKLSTSLLGCQIISFKGIECRDHPRSEVEWLGRLAQDQGSPVQVPVIPDHFISHVHQYSSTGVSKAKWCVDCPWFMNRKDSLGSF
jgi:hypothetical protein